MAKKKAVAVKDVRTPVSNKPAETHAPKLAEVTNFVPDVLPDTLKSVSRSKDRNIIWLQLRDMKPGDSRSATYEDYGLARRAQSLVSDLAAHFGWQSIKSYDTMKIRKKLRSGAKALYATYIVKTNKSSWKLYVVLTAP